MENSVYIKLFKYCVVGFSGMAVDFSTTWLLKEKFAVNKYVANTTGFVLAASFNFILNRYWTFHSKSPDIIHEYTLFFIISLIGLALNTFVLFLFTEKVRWNFYLSKLLAIVIVTLWNFSMNYFFTFK